MSWRKKLGHSMGHLSVFHHLLSGINDGDATLPLWLRGKASEAIAAIPRRLAEAFSFTGWLRTR